MLTLIQRILLLLWTSVGSASAEKLYHLRDHSDVPTVSAHQARLVTDKHTAEVFLSRYGFIKPVYREETQVEGSASAFADDFLDAFGDAVQEGGSQLPSRDGDFEDPDDVGQSFLSALEEFQRVSGLPVTGVFDEATREAMNKPRCGVPDRGIVWNAAVGPESSDPGTSSINGADGNRTASNGSVAADSLEDEAYRLNGTDVFNLRGHVSNNTSLNVSYDGDVDSRAVNAGLHQSQRRKRHLATLITKNRRRRDVSERGYVAFSKKLLKWRLIGEGYSSQLTVEEQRYIFRLAFRMWSEVSPLEFVEDTRSPLEDVDIRLGFGTGRHLGCNQRFDGTGQEFAHAWFLGDIHFDDDEHFTAPNMGSGISLLKVAVHEIGHVLGLPHIYRSGSIMQPSYLPQESGFEMSWMDRKAIQRLYGGCKGRFSAVFDWIRKEKTPYGEVVVRFNTYFMRDSWYWLYENRKNRTRYGDPVKLQIGWHGLPKDGVDAHVHVWSRKRDVVYFFRGTRFWRYDSEKDQVFRQDPEGHRYPRPISEGFPGVIGPIDTAFYDRRDSHIYFFKNTLVYAFNVEANSLASGFPKNIRDVFPATQRGDHPDGGIDAAYFSYTHNTVFLLKGTRFWRVAGGRERRRRLSLPRNGLLPHKEVEEQWFDICNVHPTALALKR